MERPRPRRALTLVELVVVVLILGVMAGIAAPMAMQSQNDSSTAATIQHLETIALALEMHRNEQGQWPAESATGVMPPSMTGYLRPNLFAVPCPVGGTYDWDNPGGGAQLSVVGVGGDELWLRIDQQIDDGNLTTGDLQMLASPPGRRVVWILSP